MKYVQNGKENSVLVCSWKCAKVYELSILLEDADSLEEALLFIEKERLIKAHCEENKYEEIEIESPALLQGEDLF